MRAMASVPTTFVPTESRTDSRGENLRIQSPGETPLFHFGLRQLFVFVAAVCALLAAMAASSGLTSLILLLAVAVVVMHFFASALVTKLLSRTELSQLLLQAAQH